MGGFDDQVHDFFFGHLTHYLNLDILFSNMLSNIYSYYDATVVLSGSSVSAPFAMSRILEKYQYQV